MRNERRFSIETAPLTGREFWELVSPIQDWSSGDRTRVWLESLRRGLLRAPVRSGVDDGWRRDELVLVRKSFVRRDGMPVVKE